MAITLGLALHKMSDYGNHIKANKTQHEKDIKVNGESDEDDHLQLHSLRQASSSSKDNPNIYYDGKGGSDKLQYSGGTKSVTMTVSTNASYDFYLDGGRGTNHGDLNLNSLDVWTEDVEIYDLTSSGDTVDLSNWSGGYEITIYAGDGSDTLIGSVYADRLYGQGGSDTINAGDGDDFVDPGDINTGAQETVTLGAGYDTLYLGDIGSTETDYSEITSGLSDWESFAVETGTSLPATLFSSGMKSVFSAWTKANPVSAMVISVAFEVGGSALGTLLTSILGGSKGSSASYGGDDSSGVWLTDFNTTEDTIILPITNFDDPDASVGDATTGKMVFELDAENGGKFLKAYITNTDGDGTGSDNGDFTQFLTDVYLDANGSFVSGYDIWDIHSRSTVNSALITGTWDSRIMFSKSREDATSPIYIRAQQGDELLYDSLDSSVAGDVDFSDMASTLDSSLGEGDSVMIVGNFIGQSVSLDGDRRYANGNDQSDTFTITASGKDSAYYVNGNDGNDLLEIGQLKGVDINFHGGEGTDIVSFANAHVWGDSGAAQSTYGLQIDLRNQSHDFVSDVDAFETDQGAGTAPDAQLWSVEGIIGSSKSDRLIGNEDDNVLMTNGGGDHIEGGGGDDVIRGGSGWDRMYGDRHNGTNTYDDGDDYFYTGLNSDLIWGGGGNDTADFSETSRNGWTIDLSDKKDASGHWAFKTNSTTGTYVESKVTGHQTLMSGIENVVGTYGNDTLIGDEAANRLSGLSGNDTLSGNAGADTLVAGAGDDTLTGGSDADIFVFDMDVDGSGTDVITDFESGDKAYLLADSIDDSFISTFTFGTGAVAFWANLNITFTGLSASDLNLADTSFTSAALGYDGHDAVLITI